MSPRINMKTIWFFLYDFDIYPEGNFFQYFKYSCVWQQVLSVLLVLKRFGVLEDFNFQIKDFQQNMGHLGFAKEFDLHYVSRGKPLGVLKCGYDSALMPVEAKLIYVLEIRGLT